MNFNTNDEKIEFFKKHLESRDMLVEVVDTAPEFKEIKYHLSGTRIESFTSDPVAKQQADGLLKNSGNIALINALKNKTIDIYPKAVFEIMVFLMEDNEGEYFALKAIAQLSFRAGVEQVLHRGTIDAGTPPEEFIAFVEDSFEQMEKVNEVVDQY